jgi:hypothetical protein
MADRPQHALQIMETQTRFDLNTAIVDWQQELAGQPNLTPIVRRELETHLRDTIAELQRRGLNGEESFWLARRRVGRPQQLGEEFSKTDPAKVWRERVFWMTLALLVIALWGGSINLLSALTLTAVRLWATGPVVNVFTIFFSSAFQLLFNWGVIVAGAVFLAKGRFDFRGKRWNNFIHSRLRLIIVGGLWMIFNSGTSSVFLIWNWTHSRSAVWDTWYNIIPNLFHSVAWPGMLLTLVLWLAPKRTVSIPSHV